MAATVAQLEEVCHEVMAVLGAGFSEAVYHKAVETELRLRNIQYQSEVVLPVEYKGHNVGSMRADLVVGHIVLEFKALTAMVGPRNCKLDSASKQLLRYCKRLQCPVGMVVNFAQDTESVQCFTSFVGHPTPAAD